MEGWCLLLRLASWQAAEMCKSSAQQHVQHAAVHEWAPAGIGELVAAGVAPVRGGGGVGLVDAWKLVVLDAPALPAATGTQPVRPLLHASMAVHARRVPLNASDPAEHSMQQ